MSTSVHPPAQPPGRPPARPGVQQAPHASVRAPAGVRLAGAGCALAGVLTASGQPRASGVVADVVVAAVCLVSSCGASPVTAACVGGLAWGVQDGFVAHRFGDLGASGGDVATLAVLVALAVGTALASRVRRPGRPVHPVGPAPRPGSVTTPGATVRGASGLLPAPRGHD